MTDTPLAAMIARSVRYARPGTVIVGLAVLAAVAACAETVPSRFYTLAPAAGATEATAASAPKDLTIGLGPVVLPNYLDRPEIVRRTGEYELDIAEFDRWSESLDSMVPRIMTQNLAATLGTDRVMIFPQRRAPEAAYQVEIEVFRFDAGSNDEVVLDAQWEIYGGRGERPLALRKQTFRQPIDGEGYAAVAGAMSAALAALSTEIAADLRNQQTGR
ncbi:MAG: membrane integrity-associated transporter subunit PqiC [Rhodospirillales bacterium]|nr:membrane integrity-associated transporter subunit PqiC [Rhodospirillales bacterium]